MWGTVRIRTEPQGPTPGQNSEAVCLDCEIAVVTAVQ